MKLLRLKDSGLHQNTDRSFMNDMNIFKSTMINVQSALSKERLLSFSIYGRIFSIAVLA